MKIRLNIFFVFSLIVLTLTIFFSSISKIKVSYDGTMYLISAKSIFTSDMGEMYQWIREPGYPLFIKIFAGDELNYQLLILAQSIFLALSVIFVFSYFYSNSSKSKSSKFIYFFAGILSFLLVYGYSTWILQQFFFIFLTSLHIVYIWVIQKKKIKHKQLLAISSLLITSASVWSIILLPASIGTVLFAIFKFQKNSFNDFRKHKLLFISIIIAPSIVFTGAWNTFKISESENNQRIYSEPVFIGEYGNFALDDFLYWAPARMGGILGITNEVLPGFKVRPPANNHFYYAFNNFHGGLGCGVFDGGLKEVKDILELKPENFINCNDALLTKNFLVITKAIKPFLPIFLFFAFLYLIHGWITKNSVLICGTFFSIFSFFPYLVEPYGISRYGATFIFLSPFILAVSLDRLLSAHSQPKK